MRCAFAVEIAAPVSLGSAQRGQYEAMWIVAARSVHSGRREFACGSIEAFASPISSWRSFAVNVIAITFTSDVAPTETCCFEEDQPTTCRDGHRPARAASATIH